MDENDGLPERPFFTADILGHRLGGPLTLIKH